MKRLLVSLAASALAFTLASPARAGLVNGGFELPLNGRGSIMFPSSIPGWQTNDTRNSFEIWNSGAYNVYAYEGKQFAELNAYSASTLWQDVAGIAGGSRVGFQFAHRGRAGEDTMSFTLTDLGADGKSGGGGLDKDTVLFTKNYSDSKRRA